MVLCNRERPKPFFPYPNTKERKRSGYETSLAWPDPALWAAIIIALREGLVIDNSQVCSNTLNFLQGVN